LIESCVTLSCKTTMTRSLRWAFSSRPSMNPNVWTSLSPIEHWKSENFEDKCLKPNSAANSWSSGKLMEDEISENGKRNGRLDCLGSCSEWEIALKQSVFGGGLGNPSFVFFFGMEEGHWTHENWSALFKDSRNCYKQRSNL
jgi:hypothetical protein